MAEQSVGTPLSMHDPRSVGPWTIHSRLGAGGMGVVFYATKGPAAAALKVIRPGLLDAPATRDRFRREVAILRSVRDLHICQYLDADLESEPAWLALEYLSGATLREEVLANGPLPEPEWWELARGLAQALSVLEIHRITHRDLKPGNVMLNERGPVLIDFGIAHPEDATQLTATGLVTGSPAWLSPEQANLEQTGPATDVFTLGSLLAFAATGRPPFGEGASVAVLMAIIKREPDLEGVDPARAALLHRLMAKDPDQRPTARDVLDLARAAQAGTLLDNPAAAAVARAAAGTPATQDESPTPPLDAGATRADAIAAPGPDGLGAPPPVGPEVTSPSAVADLPAGDSTQPDLPAVAAPGPAPVPSPAAPSPVPSERAQDVAPPLAPAPVRAAGSRGTGPRTLAAQERRGRRRRTLGVLIGLVAVILAGWLVLGQLGNGATPGSGGNTTSSSQPPSAESAPPAPSSDQLGSGDWFLDAYRLNNDSSGSMTITGTVRNRGNATASAHLTVWVYLGDQSLGSVSTTVTDVPAGKTVSVEMAGDAVWKPGEKVVLLEAS